jgi:hypothetical protein
MVASSTPAQVPAESAPVHLREHQQPTRPGQSPGAIIIHVQRSHEHENWRTYSNTAY